MAIPSTLKKMGPPVRATALVGSRESRLMAKAKFFLFFFFFFQCLGFKEVLLIEVSRRIMYMKHLHCPI